MTWTVPFPSGSAEGSRSADDGASRSGSFLGGSTRAAFEGPTSGDDRAILKGYLNWQRRTLLNVCAGLDSAQLAAQPVPPSTLSLLGLVRHLAKVERVWLRQRVAGQDVMPLYGGPGDAAEFARVDPAYAQAEVEQLCQEWKLADSAAADISFDAEIEVRGETWSVRMVYQHLIEEYARHNGHADLLRQVLDGVTGR